MRQLTERGYRIAVLKHSSSDFEIDVPGKDTYRLAAAGASAVVITSPEKFALFQRNIQEPALDELCAMVTNVDLIITEGYKKENKPKIEVARREIDAELMRPDNLIAAVTDFPVDEMPIPVFPFTETAALTQFIIERFLSAAR